MIVDAKEVTADEAEQLAPDNTIGLLTKEFGDHFEAADLFDLNRIQAAIAEYRNHFDEDLANIAVIEDQNGLRHLALWPDAASQKAVVVPQRVREEEGNQ